MPGAGLTNVSVVATLKTSGTTAVATIRRARSAARNASNVVNEYPTGPEIPYRQYDNQRRPGTAQQGVSRSGYVSETRR